MIANWKMLGASLLLVLFFSGMCSSDALGQATRQPRGGNAANQPPGYGPAVGMPMRGGAQAGRPAVKSNENLCIVEVGKELQIVSKPKGVNELKKQVKEKFAAAKKAYNDAKKDKNNKGVKIEEPKEKDYMVKEVKSSLKSQEEAQKALDKLVADRNKSSSK
jgi:hypothetical protein